MINTETNFAEIVHNVSGLGPDIDFPSRERNIHSFETTTKVKSPNAQIDISKLPQIGGLCANED